MFAGIDVGSESIMVFWGKERPVDVRSAYRNALTFKEFDLSNIEELLSLGISRAFLEPTGVHYSRLWASILERSGVKLYWVGHKELQAYRKVLNLKDKDDKADALALMCYGFDFYPSEAGRFLLVREKDCAKLRDFYFRLGFYQRLRNQLINRLRQDLVFQFPEVANVSVARSTHGNIPLLVRWLSGEENSKKYDTKYEQTRGEKLINVCTIFNSELLYDIFAQEQWIESEIAKILSLNKFSPYLEAFAEFRMDSLRTAAFLISQIYPLQQFLGPDGTPIVEKVPSASGKTTTRRISEDKFKARLATVPSRNFSGQSKKFTKEGSSEARKVLWRWFYVIIEREKSRPTSEVGQKIVQCWLDGRESGMPVKKLRAKCRSKTAVLLFRRLCDRLLLH